MNLIWLPRARDDVRKAFRYIANDSQTAAEGVVTRLRMQVKTLAEFPKSGRPGRVPGTREMVISRTPYVVAYRIVGDVVEILAVLHGARRWPESF